MRKLYIAKLSSLLTASTYSIRLLKLLNATESSLENPCRNTSHNSTQDIIEFIRHPPLRNPWFDEESNKEMVAYIRRYIKSLKKVTRLFQVKN